MTTHAPHPIIEVKHLVTRFGMQVVHDDLELSVYPGEILGVIGGSGAGKSVLLRTILGLQRPQHGTIHIMHKNITRMTYEKRKMLNEQTGVLFQSGALFTSLTVADNIKVPLKEITRMPDELANQVVALKLDMVGLARDTAYKYPSALSGGMVKRVALARALALDPKILFLDEPTSGLDPLSAEGFDQLLLDLHKILGLTVFMITHDLDTLATVCQRLAVIVNKKAIVDTYDGIKHYDDPWIHAYFHGPRAIKVFGG